LRLATVPSGSEDVIERVIVWNTCAVVVFSVKVTPGGLSAIVLVAVELLLVEPELSVAFT
jgi:hypothetical protein